MILVQDEFGTGNLTNNVISSQISLFMRGYSVITYLTISKLDIKKHE
ncbi:MAG TPA: hypothetical protein VIH04_00605 [Nitrosarchaeum sp.]